MDGVVREVVGSRRDEEWIEEVYEKVFEKIESTQSWNWRKKRVEYPRPEHNDSSNRFAKIEAVARIAKKDAEEFRDLQRLLGETVKKYVKSASIQHYIVWKKIKEEIERIESKPSKTLRDIQRKNVLYQLLIAMVTRYMLDVLRRGKDSLRLPEVVRVAKKFRRPKRKYVIGIAIDRFYDPLKVPKVLQRIRKKLANMGIDPKETTIITFTGQWSNIVKKYFEESEVIVYSTLHVEPRVNYIKASEFFTAYLAVHGGLLFATFPYKSFIIAASRYGVPLIVVNDRKVEEFAPYSLLRYFTPRRVYGNKAQEIARDLQRIYEIGKRMASISGYPPTFLSTLEAAGLRTMISKGKNSIQVYPFEPTCMGDKNAIDYPFTSDIVGVTDDDCKRIIRIELWTGVGGEETLKSWEYGEVAF